MSDFDSTEPLATDGPNDQDLWRAVLRTAVDPIIIIDQTGVIVHTNEATEKLFDLSTDQLVGRNVSSLMPEPHRSRHDGYLARYLETGEAHIIGAGREVEARRADGSVFPVALSVSEIELGGRSWFTGILHDLTERHLVEAELREAKEGLEERVRQRTAELEASMIELSRSNRDLEQFAYIASHDLQAPLRNVRQGLELIDDHLQETFGENFDDEARELRDLTVAAVVRMEELIRGLLWYSRLNRSGKPPREQVDLRALAEEILDQMAAELAEASATVDVSELPVVAGDPVQLRQLLQNLLENALKYRDRTRPLQLTINAEQASEGMWRISIGDNGIGIDVEQHGRIFELFRRAHSGYDGMGLGLAICQRIVERHGGEIWVEAGPAGGSVFRFTVPGPSGRGWTGATVTNPRSMAGDDG